MATARERLLQALLAIISQPFSEEGKVALSRLLNSYRVQAKPGENLPKDQTARNALADKIVEAWKQSCPLDRKFLSRVISSFRMQLKQGFSRSRMLESKQSQKEAGQEVAGQSMVSARAKAKDIAAKQENAYFKDKAKNVVNPEGSTQIAGGPKQNPKSRGQCPKCRSIGIVLARAYGGDDYHSCIYCGYQAYLKNTDPKLDLPLAAELLGDAFGDPEINNDD